MDTIKVDGVECEVVQVKQWTRDDPKWEVMAPDGYLFDGELSGLLCFTLADVRERVRSVELVADDEVMV